jgi:hypothetical protein
MKCYICLSFIKAYFFLFLPHPFYEMYPVFITTLEAYRTPSMKLVVHVYKDHANTVLHVPGVS